MALFISEATLVISFTTFITVFAYEKLKRNMDLTLLLAFILSAISFLVVYIIKQPAINIALMVVAILASNGAATILWSMYCPSLKDTGRVSSATGFLDFMSYMAAAASTSLFANAVSSIGWEKLILVWFGITFLGVIVALPRRIKKDTELSIGDIGIFSVDGMIYCKQYFLDKENNLLLKSANREFEYADVYVDKNSGSDVRVLGKVII